MRLLRDAAILSSEEAGTYARRYPTMYPLGYIPYTIEILCAARVLGGFEFCNGQATSPPLFLSVSLSFYGLCLTKAGCPGMYSTWA